MVLLPLLTFVLFVAALIDIILRQEGQVKHLPKLVWILIVILLPLIGSILWFAIGREYGTSGGRSVLSMPRVATTMPVQEFTATPRDGELSTEEQLAQIDREIEYYERQAHLERLEAEVERKRKSLES
ncbi:PLDc N-terminal domain-containing protein [Leifsonia sp. NPDC058230]|uniref:PLDc N-terminal domain-containing protein n=1 Tax=Leifsonia sp. NPDC058230 TaxID=3346391 RepID=UPI0036D83DBE